MIAPPPVEPGAGPAPGHLAVIVVSFGAPHLLRENLATMDLPGPPDTVVVVDNFRSAADRRANETVARAAGWTFLPMDRNPGFGTAVNIGARHALAHGADRLLVLNPDARLTAGAIERLRAAVDRDPMTLVSPRIVDGTGRVWFQGMRVDPRTGDVASAAPDELAALGPDGWLSGACLMVSRTLWEASDGFDEDYFLYWEDIDFSRRCVQAGARLMVLPEAEAVHDVGGTQGGAHSAAASAAGSTAKTPLYYYYHCRNRLLFAAKHLPAAERRRWALATPSASKRILYRGGRRQLLRSPKPLLWTVGGSVAGLLRLVPRPGRSRSVVGSSRKANPNVMIGAEE